MEIQHSRKEQPKRFLNCVKCALIFLGEWVRKPVREGAQLVLLLVN